MKLFITVIALLLLNTATAFAQKDLPVCGHAATLVDLLKKDYNAVDPDLRQEEMSKDMTLVISIFKSYLIDKSKVKTDPKTDSIKHLEKYRQELNGVKKQLTSFTSLSNGNISGGGIVEGVASKINTLSNEYEKKKNSYFITKYYIDKIELTAIGKVYDGEKNAYLTSIINALVNKFDQVHTGKADNLSSTNPTSEIQKSIPFIGGNIGFETIMDGLAKFLAKRIKEELTTAVIEKVKVWLQNPSPDDPLAEFKVLLPHTTAFLVGFSADKVGNFPNEIKQYIEDDLEHLLQNAGNLRNTYRIKQMISLNPDLDFAMEAIEILPLISKMKTPADYFSLLETSRNLNRWKTDANQAKHNTANAIFMANLLARSMTVIDNGETKFASVSFLTAYGQESDFFLCYLGFLHQQNQKYYNIDFLSAKTGKVELKDKLATVVKDTATVNQIKTYKELVNNILSDAATNAEKIYAIAQEMKKANQAGKKLSADTIYNFVDNIIGFSEKLVSSVDRLTDKLINNETATIDTLNLVNRTKTFFKVAHISNEVVNDLSHKRYASALLKTVNLSGTLSEDKNFSQLIASVQSISNLPSDDKIESWHELIGLLTTNEAVGMRLNSKQIKALQWIDGELVKLSFQLRQIEDTNDIPLDSIHIQALQKLSSAGLRSGFVSAAQMKEAFNTINNNEFKTFIISYYTNVNLKQLIAKAVAELTSIEIKKKDGNVVKVFAPHDAENLTYGIEKYVRSIYDSYFIKGSNQAAQREAKEFLMTTISSYLAILPQRFDIASNKRLLSLVHFINDMALATNSDDVAKAIEAFALPSGSYAIKRAAKFNLTLNAYPGILPAYEVSGGKCAFSIGFTAPVGLGISWGSKGGDVDGIFLPIIDIGALTRLRLTNSDSTKTLPSFQFKNVVAPGLYYSHGFRRSPFTLNAGVQYGPELQKIDAAGNLYSSKSGNYRFGIGIVFDIPLLNLNTNPR